MFVYFSWVVRFFLLLGPRAHLVCKSKRNPSAKSSTVNGAKGAQQNTMVLTPGRGGDRAWQRELRGGDTERVLVFGLCVSGGPGHDAIHLINSSQKNASLFRLGNGMLRPWPRS